MLPATDPELVDFAVDVVRQAGQLTLELFRTREFGIERKGDGSPVTQADRNAERLMRELIAARFPDDEISGEEEPLQSGTSGRRWVIDPIDGTESFTRGVVLYTTLLSFEDEHGPAIGVIDVPPIGELVAAGRGLGCTLNGRPCRVNDQTALSRSVLTTSGFEWWTEEMMTAAHRQGFGLRTWGDGYAYVLLASGRVEAVIDPEVSDYDVAPCKVIVTEAGGRWDTFDHNADRATETFVASNGVLHDDVLAIIHGSRPVSPQGTP